MRAKFINELKKITGGDCYYIAGKFMMDLGKNDDHLLVHSMVDGRGPLEGIRFGHAWIEYEDMVIDKSNGKYREIPTDLYYTLGNVRKEDTKYYTHDEMIKWLLETEHWGPWEMSGDPIKLY